MAFASGETFARERLGFRGLLMGIMSKEDGGLRLFRTYYTWPFRAKSRIQKPTKRVA